MLGLVPPIAAFFALPLDVRHVTLASGQLAAAVGALGLDTLLSAAFWWCVAGIAVTGAFNLAVSFFLAFRVAAALARHPPRRRKPDPRRLPRAASGTSRCRSCCRRATPVALRRLTMRMPLWTLIVPLVSLPLAGAALVWPPGAVAGRGLRDRPLRLGARLGASRRGRGAPRRRALRHADPRGLGDRDRGRADRLDDARRRQRQVGAAARHDLLGDHDHLQRRRRPVRDRRRPQAPRAELSPRRRDLGAGRADRPGDAVAGAAGVHDHRARAGDVLDLAARLRRGRLARPVGGVRVRADGAPPRLLPAARPTPATNPRTRRRLRSAWPGRASACSSSRCSR